MLSDWISGAGNVYIRVYKLLFLDGFKFHNHERFYNCSRTKMQWRSFGRKVVPSSKVVESV